MNQFHLQMETQIEFLKRRKSGIVKYSKKLQERQKTKERKTINLISYLFLTTHYLQNTNR